MCSTVRWLALSQQEGPEFNTTMRPGSFSVAFACSPRVPQLKRISRGEWMNNNDNNSNNNDDVNHDLRILKTGWKVINYH